MFKRMVNTLPKKGLSEEISRLKNDTIDALIKYFLIIWLDKSSNNAYLICKPLAYHFVLARLNGREFYKCADDVIGGIESIR